MVQTVVLGLSHPISISFCRRGLALILRMVRGGLDHLCHRRCVTHDLAPATLITPEMDAVVVSGVVNDEVEDEVHVVAPLCHSRQDAPPTRAVEACM